MKDIVRKTAALILALAMIVTFTPIYGMGAIAYAEDEEVAAEQNTAGGEDLAAGEEVSGNEAGEGDQISPDEEDPVGEDPIVEEPVAGDESAPEEVVVEEAAGEEEQPFIAKGIKKAPISIDKGDDDGDGDGDDNPFPFPNFELEQTDGVQGRLYDTGLATFKIPDEAFEVEGTLIDEIEPFVGIPQDGPWESLGTDCFDYDSDRHTITVYGGEVAEAIAEMFPSEDWVPDQIGISFEAFDGADHSDGHTLWIAGAFVDMHYSYISENLPEDRNVLPHWDGTINETIWAYVDTFEHPHFGNDTPMQITAVEVSDDDLELLEDFHPDSYGDDNWWYYRAGSEMGTVTFHITYTDYDGVEKTHDMHLHIGGHVYNVNLWTEGGVYHVLPGGEINLHAWGEHKYAIGDREEFTQEGLDYIWTIERGSEFAKIVMDDNDHSSAKLVFNDMSEGENDYSASVQIKVTVIDTTDEDDPSGKKASEDRWFNCESDFYELYPLEIENRLGLGERLDDLKPEIRHYKAGGSEAEGFNSENYEVINPDRIWWEFDDNAMKITTKDGSSVDPGDKFDGDESFSLERLKPWGTDIRLFADFKRVDGGEDQRDRNFWFDDLNYNIWMESEGDRVYDDAEWTVNIGRDDDLNYDNIEIRYTFEAYRHDDEIGQDIPIDFPNDCYRKSEDGMTLTLIGPAMAQEGVDSVRVNVEAYYNNTSLDRRDDRMFWLEESCISRGEEHLWLEAPPEYADCYSPGWQKMMCWNCGERRTIEVPARGHIATAVKAKAATASKEGNVAYWKCSFCGKCFSDKACTKEVTADSRIIPKGTTISKVAAASKGFTVTWKKPTGNYLKHTTGYEVQYALDSKFKKSAKTVAITKSATVSKKVTKLKAKTKYFVRVRTYRTIDGKKVYGPWSAVKNVKTK